MLILPCRASPTTADRQSFAPLSAVRSTKSQDRSRAVCQELLIPTLPITDLQDGWFFDPHHGHGTGRPGEPDAVRLAGRSNNQPQPERRCLAILSHQCVSPGLAATLQICYGSLAMVFLEEKTALRPRNSRPLAAVCRTKSPRQIRESALFHRLRTCDGRQDSKPARMSISISPRQEHKRTNPWTAGTLLAAVSGTRDQVDDGGPTRAVVTVAEAIAAPGHLMLGPLQRLQSTIYLIMPCELANGKILPADADIGFAQYPHRRFDQLMVRGGGEPAVRVWFLDGIQREAANRYRRPSPTASTSPTNSRQARSPESKS